MLFRSAAVASAAETPAPSPEPAESPAPTAPAVPAHTKSLDTTDGYRLTLDVTAQDSMTSETDQQVVSNGHANIVLLLDLTSSMTQSFGGATRIEALRTAATSFVEALPAQDAQSKVDIITYWDDNYRFRSAATGWTALDAEGRESLLETCGALEAAYTTNYATDQRSALAAAGTALNEVFSNGNASYVLLFTDGEPSGGSSYYSTLEIAQGAVNNAKNLKALGVTVYTVGILDSADTSAAMSSSMKMTYDSLYGTFSGVDVMMNAVSSNYPAASAGAVQSDSSIGMFGGQSVTVAMGDGGNDGYYLLGSNAGELNEKFKNIGETITEEITTTTAVPMTGVVISDTLSDYVALDGAFDPVVTADGAALVKGTDYTASVSGKTVSVAFTGALTDGVTYAVSFPVVPDATLPNGTYPTNNGAALTWQYGDAAAETAPYAEEPTFTLARFYTVKWVNADGTVLETDESVPYGETPRYDGATPTKAADAQYSYVFDKWTPEITAVTGDVTYTATFRQTTNTYTVTWKNADGTVLETDENVPYGETPRYDGAEPTKAATAEFTYAFDKWTPELSPVTGDVTYTATYTQTPVPQEVTLTYVSNGGTEYAPETYTAGTVVTLDKTPFRESHSFTGWYADAALTQSVESVTMNGDRTVYAGWKATEVPPELNGADHFAYVAGYEDGTVRPENPITRAEVAMIFYRLLNADVRAQYETSDNAFTDVQTGDWYNTAVSTMAAMGILKGRTAETFDPNAPITRAEFAAICARFDRSEITAEVTFTDTQTHWAKDDIARASALGWIRGRSTDVFDPDARITRAEAMTLINRVLRRLPESADSLLDGMRVWPDNAADSWYYLAVQEATNSHTAVQTEAGENWQKLIADPDRGTTP